MVKLFIIVKSLMDKLTIIKLNMAQKMMDKWVVVKLNVAKLTMVKTYTIKQIMVN
jgi:hypothetical protein